MREEGGRYSFKYLARDSVFYEIAYHKIVLTTQDDVRKTYEKKKMMRKEKR